jgi:hypothetical protein
VTRAFPWGHRHRGRSKRAQPFCRCPLTIPLMRYRSAHQQHAKLPASVSRTGKFARTPGNDFRDGGFDPLRTSPGVLSLPVCRLLGSWHETGFSEVNDLRALEDAEHDGSEEPAILINQLGLMLRTLVLVSAATALRISEILACSGATSTAKINAFMFVEPTSTGNSASPSRKPQTSRSAPSCSRGSFAQLATGNAIQQGRRTCVPLFQAEGQKAAASQHAFVRSSPACSRESRS